MEAKRLPKATGNPFCRKLAKTLDDIGFAEGVRVACMPRVCRSEEGQPSRHVFKRHTQPTGLTHSCG